MFCQPPSYSSSAAVGCTRTETSSAPRTHLVLPEAVLQVENAAVDDRPDGGQGRQHHRDCSTREKRWKRNKTHTGKGGRRRRGRGGGAAATSAAVIERLLPSGERRYIPAFGGGAWMLSLCWRCRCCRSKEVALIYLCPEPSQLLYVLVKLSLILSTASASATTPRGTRRSENKTRTNAGCHAHKTCCLHEKQ